MNGAWWQSRRFALLMVALAAVPLLLPAIPPFTDVPGHMGRYRVMLDTDTGTLSQWYQFTWRPIGYLGGDLLAAVLAPLLGLELAVKAIVITIPMLTVAGILWISHEAHGRVQPLALLALPLAYHPALQYGFINYTLAMALTLNAWALWIRLGRLRRFRLRAALFVPFAFVIWSAHLFGWLMLGMMAFATELMRERASGRTWPAAIFHGGLACLPLAPPFAMFLGWRPGEGGAESDWLPGLKLKPGWLVTVLRDRWRWFDIASIILIALSLYRCVRSPRFGHAVPITAAAVGALAMFVAMPFMSAFADMRLAPYAVMFALLAIRCDSVSPREQRVLAGIGLAFVLVRTTAGAASLWIENRDWERHLEAVERIPRGARVAAFVGANCERPWHVERFAHLPSMAIVRRAAFTNDQFDLGATALLRVVAPGVEGYALDPSQIVVDRTCKQSSEFRTLDVALAGLPRTRFDHVWLIRPPAFDPRGLRGMTLVWRNGTDMLLRIESPEAPVIR